MPTSITKHHSLQAFPRTDDGQKMFRQIVLWCQQQSTLEQGHNGSAEIAAPSKLLAWLCHCIEQGCSLSGSSEEAAWKLCREVLQLQQHSERRSPGGLKCQHDAVVILLHILHPILAQFFYESESPIPWQLEASESAEQPSPQGITKINGEPGSLEAMQAGGEHISHTAEEAGASNVKDSVSCSAWKESSSWLFLLGNTLLRLLDLTGLPRFSQADNHWPFHRCSPRVSRSALNASLSEMFRKVVVGS